MSEHDLKLNTSRLLLTKIRGGDYVHAGDREAVEIVTKKALSFDPTLKDGPTLDVGSGFGGTAQDLHEAGFKNICGIDRDKAAIAYSAKKYPAITFTAGDALTLDQVYEADQFSFVYLFNVIYAIEDKATLLAQLSAVSKPNAILAIFDYTQGKTPLLQHDLGGKPMYPLSFPEFEKTLQQTGWEVLEREDITSQYITWYEGLLHKLSQQRSALDKDFTSQDLGKVESTFTVLVEKLKQGTAGGGTIYARKRKESK